MNIFIENLKTHFSTPSRIVLSVLDVILLATLVYVVSLFLKRNNAKRLIPYFAIFFVAGLVIYIVRDLMPVSGSIFAYIILIIVFALFALFPHEFRRAMWKFALPREKRGTHTAQYDCTYEDLEKSVTEIVKAVQNMSKRNTGALIIIAPEDIPTHIIESGTSLNALVSCQLLESIFNTKAPLHDGAVYVRGNKILAAGCFLPLSQNTNIDKNMGTRHRAAIGVTEEFNHLAIIVSEETGIISIARNGGIDRYYDTKMLTEVLQQTYGLKVAMMEKKF